jgi:hypothetical protein
MALKGCEKRWEGFDEGNYNYPPEGWREVSETEFARAFFQFISDRQEYRQLYRFPKDEYRFQKGGLVSARLFWFYEEPLGVAMEDDVLSSEESKIRYFKFGTEESWKSFCMEFAQQFAGDNS